MPDICFGFEVHQPYRLNRTFSPVSKVKKKDLFDHYFDALNKEILLRVADKCYIPATQIILEKLDEGFSCAFSLSGTVVEQFRKWSPETLSLFEDIARHKNTELIGQTYYHSIASCFLDKSEFREQVKMHSDLMFDQFRLVRSCLRILNLLSITISPPRYGIWILPVFLPEGVDRVLGWRSPNYLYRCQNLPVLLRNIKLSDDIAFRFANRSWDMYPLTADTYAQWIASSARRYHHGVSGL